MPPRAEDSPSLTAVPTDPGEGSEMLERHVPVLIVGAG
eukprot:CAMPEP_0181036512 /NCGR_PEP_ID=MMETSP1070-20121207/8899_1 /TAXON_ID=265543 /ORGANISM="Minutocellus polymorphus, Strain NH13" /LENGTH=37 /DNA_ID= /DNA_START= /DNA_END= /DNA_ORIENTATION=